MCVQASLSTGHFASVLFLHAPSAREVSSALCPGHKRAAQSPVGLPPGLCCHVRGHSHWPGPKSKPLSHEDRRGLVLGFPFSSPLVSTRSNLMSEEPRRSKGKWPYVPKPSSRWLAPTPTSPYETVEKHLSSLPVSLRLH